MLNEDARRAAGEHIHVEPKSAFCAGDRDIFGRSGLCGSCRGRPGGRELLGSWILREHGGGPAHTSFSVPSTFYFYSGKAEGSKSFGIGALIATSVEAKISRPYSFLRPGCRKKRWPTGDWRYH
jgi:hypothetical protein